MFNHAAAVIAGIVVAVTVGVVLLFLAHVYVTVPGVLLVVWRIRNLIIKVILHSYNLCAVIIIYMISVLDVGKGLHSTITRNFNDPTHQ